MKKKKIEPSGLKDEKEEDVEVRRLKNNKERKINEPSCTAFSPLLNRTV